MRQVQHGQAWRAEVPVEGSGLTYRVLTTVDEKGVGVMLSQGNCVTQTTTPLAVRETTTTSPSVLGSVIVGAAGAGLIGLGGVWWGKRDDYPSSCPLSEPDCTTQSSATSVAASSIVLGSIVLAYSVLNLFKPSRSSERIVEQKSEAESSSPHACAGAVSNVPLQLNLSGHAPITATTDATGRTFFALASESRAAPDFPSYATVTLPDGRVGATVEFKSHTARAAAPTASLGESSESDGCIPGYIYPVQGAGSLDADYSSADPVRHVWSCGWNVSAPAGGVALGGLVQGRHYAARHQGVFTVPTAARYSFPVAASGDYRIRIDGRVVERGAEVALDAGRHALLVEYLYPAGAAFNLNIQIAINGAPAQPWTFESGSRYYARQGVHYVGASPLASDYQSLATVQAKEIRINEQVRFKPASDEIVHDDKSEAVLFAVAKALSDHPEISHIEIQGHTDGQGEAARNLDLSNRRAAAVRNWLVNAGIAPHRMQARGYGATVPIATNSTEQGRASNRRVQFTLEKSATSPTPSTATASSAPNSGCDIKRVDWEHFSYPASELFKAPFTLGSSGNSLDAVYAGVKYHDLDGQGQPEALVRVDASSDWESEGGNAVPPDPPAAWYLFRMSNACAPEALGSIHVHEDERVELRHRAILVEGKADNHSEHLWSLQGAKVELVTDAKAAARTLATSMCDDASFLSRLRGMAGQLPFDLLRDPCMRERLTQRLGAHRNQFEDYTSGGAAPMHVQDGRLIASICRKSSCDDSRAAFAIDVSTGVIDCAIVSGKKVSWFAANGSVPKALRDTITRDMQRQFPGTP